jgi:hypothetical protein
MPVTPVIPEAERRGSQSKAGPGKSRKPYLKNEQTKITGGMEVVASLPSKHEVLHSIPITTEGKKS